MADTGTQFISRYLLPFHINNLKAYEKTFLSKGTLWEQTSVSTKYLAPHIEAIFSNEGRKNMRCRCYRLKQDCGISLPFPGIGRECILESKLIENGNSSGDSFRFCTTGIWLYSFATGTGILVMEASPEQKDNLDKLVDFNFAFARMLKRGAKTRDCVVPDKGVCFKAVPEEAGTDAAAIDMKETLEKLLGICADNSKKYSIQMWQSVLTGFCVLTGDNVGEETEIARRLANSEHTDFARNEKPEKIQHGFTYEQVEGVRWTGNAHGIVGHASNSSGSEREWNYVDNAFVPHAFEGYFYLYLLAYHEQQYMLHFKQDIVSERMNSTMATRMHTDMVSYNAVFSNTYVSEYSHYQNFYVKVREELGIDEIEEDVCKAVENLDEFAEDTKERRMNVLLTAIAILTVFSTLIDSVSFVDRCLDEQLAYGGWHYLVISLIAVAVGFGVYKIIRKK